MFGLSVGTIVSLVLTVLKLGSSFLSWAQTQKEFDSGVNSQIAKTATDLLALTKRAQEVRQEVNALPEAEVDKQLKDLEP